MDVLRDGVKPSAARQGACLAGGGTRPRTGPARAAGLRGGICHGGAGYGGPALALDFREGRRIQPRDGSHDANHRETSPRESQGWALDVPTLRCLLRSPSDPMSCCSCGDASTGSVTAGGPIVRRERDSGGLLGSLRLTLVSGNLENSLVDPDPRSVLANR